MKIPKQIIVGKDVWSVEVVDGVEDHWPDLPDNKELWGYMDPEHRAILIDSNATADERATTLLHEALHATFPEWRESWVESCALRLYPVLRDSGIWRKR